MQTQPKGYLIPLPPPPPPPRGEARLLQELTSGVSSVFPNILPLRTFVEETTRILSTLGFTRDNTLAVVGLSRDERTRPLLNALSKVWGEPYVTHSLGSQCNVGPTGLKQILSHAPLQNSQSRTKVVIFACPNMACNQDGDAGWLYRPNRPEPVPTSSELVEFVSRLKAGRFNLNPHGAPPAGDPGGVDRESLDPEDLEMSVMCAKLVNQLARDGGLNDTSLPAVSRLACRAALHDFDTLVGRHVNLESCDIAIVGAVQVHGQYQEFGSAKELKFDTEFVALQAGYAIVGGERRAFEKDQRQLALEFLG